MTKARDKQKELFKMVLVDIQALRMMKPYSSEQKVKTYN